MRKLTPITILTSLAMLPMSAFAGVVFQVETTYHSGSPGVESSEMSVEKPNLKMEIAPDRDQPTGSERDTAIFNGERKEMIVVDHTDKSYMVIDSETAGRLNGRLGGQMQHAMTDIEKHLEGLDPQQREMMEEMLRRNMPGSPSAQKIPRRTSSEFRNSRERATKQGYPCVRYDVLRDGEKVQELWVTDWSNITGGEEVEDTFLEMAAFWEETMGSFAGGGAFFETDENPFETFTEVGGFPVVTREFNGGELESETVLESVLERDLDPDAFEPPKGYRLRSMGPQ